MIILPDRNIPRSRFLMPVHASQWRAPSISVPLDQFGNHGVQTRFRVRAKTHDGVVVWAGWFDSRDDFDAFLSAIACGSLQYERPLWRLPTPMFPGLDPGMLYDFATVTFLATTGSNQTYTSPVDWNNELNSVECIAGGGSGGVVRDAASSGIATGAGAGSYSKITNFQFANPGTTTATYRVGSPGAAVSRSTNGATSGNAGTASWFNASSDPGNGSDNSKCSAAPGAGGAASAATGSSVNGGLGGATTSSWGQTKRAGGRGGNYTGTSAEFAVTGAGGAGGPTAAGENGVNTSVGNVTNGGAADVGGSGAGAGGSTAGTHAGGDGSEFDATHGCGGGGCGHHTDWDPAAPNGGGNYGGAGGAAGSSSGTISSGIGRQGLIVVTYEPRPRVAFNMPMLGM